MSERKKLISTSSEPLEDIEDVDYSETLSQSYLDYGMSVLVDRAVPDIRDGLKPVQRRILYCMYEDGITSDKPYRKCAKVSGNVSGNYHPHGTAGVDGAIVTMAQDFKKPVPLIDGQGNFGSIEGDGAAASRYIEARLEPVAEDIYMEFLKSETVEFQPNYDNTTTEPTVLPSLVPMVLLTGAEGIAVGMKTNIPTFNLSEVIDLNIMMLNSKDMSKTTVDNMLSVMKGPDFPTGGYICNPNEIKNLYETGTGKLRLRGKIEFEPGKGSERDRLVVTEIPYTMVGQGVLTFMEDVAKLVEEKELPNVVDIIDQTAQDVRVVIELSKGANVEYIKNVLYNKTKLEDTFGANMLVVCDGRPQTVSMKFLFEHYIEFQKSVFQKKYQHDLKKLQDREEILNGFILCIQNIDEVVKVIRNSKSVAEAKTNLTGKFKFTDKQCDSILAMRLSRLVSMELDKTQRELNQVLKDIETVKKVLSSDKNLVKVIVKELNCLKKRYGTDRKTVIEEIEHSSFTKIEEPATEVGVMIDRFGYVHQVDSTCYNKNIDKIETDFKLNTRTDNKSRVYVFTDTGNVYKVKVSDIPYGNLRFKGQPLENISDYDRQTEEVMFIADEKSVEALTVITERGLAKKITGQDISGTRKKTFYVTLGTGDRVFYVGHSKEEPVCVVSSDKQVLKFDEREIKNRGKGSKGNICMRFKDSNVVVEKVYRDTSNKVKLGTMGGYGHSVAKKQLVTT